MVPEFEEWAASGGFAWTASLVAERSEAALVAKQEGKLMSTSRVDAVAYWAAIDTVARRLIMRRATDDDINQYLHEFVDVSDVNWELVIKRTWELTQEIDNGQEAFEASCQVLQGASS